MDTNKIAAEARKAAEEKWTVGEQKWMVEKNKDGVGTLGYSIKAGDNDWWIGDLTTAEQLCAAHNATLQPAHASEVWTAGHDGMGYWALYRGEETKKGWSGKGRAIVTGLSERQAKDLEKSHNRTAHASERWKQDGALVLRENDGALRFEAYDAAQAYNAVERHNAAIERKARK